MIATQLQDIVSRLVQQWFLGVAKKKKDHVALPDSETDMWQQLLLHKNAFG